MKLNAKFGCESSETPRGFGLRQSSGAFHRLTCVRKAAEDCRSPRRYRVYRSQSESGSILIIVLWIAFGLVAVTLYFAHAMNQELRAADNRVAAVEANQAIDGAARYVSNILATVALPGGMRLPG